MEFFGICTKKLKIVSTRVRGSGILDFLEFVLKNRKNFQPGSEVVEFWIFLEFVLKNGKFFQPGSEVVEFWDFLEFLLKTEHFFNQGPR